MYLYVIRLAEVEETPDLRSGKFSKTKNESIQAIGVIQVTH